MDFCYEHVCVHILGYGHGSPDYPGTRRSSAPYHDPARFSYVLLDFYAV